MSDPIWISVTGMITGIIGAITGIVGSILGVVSTRKVKHLKSLDLRLELRKAEAGASIALSDLNASMEYAKQSRERVNAAKGQFKSGAMKKWHADYESDKAKAQALCSELPALLAECHDLTPEGLESRLVAVHGLQLKIASLQQHYQASIASDDEDRKQLQYDMRNTLKSLN